MNKYGRTKFQGKMLVYIYLYIKIKLILETYQVSHGGQDMAARVHGSHIQLVLAEPSSLPKLYNKGT
jgi:hypothetical protein